LKAKLASIKHETIKLDNGAEAYFLRAGDLDESKKYPMLTIVHGGPFSASPRDMFTGLRSLLLLQDITLLIINYRGSIGYGEDFMNELLGNIGVKDVHDCGQLV
jgi:acylaminoacyl-peptidase